MFGVLALPQGHGPQLRPRLLRAMRGPRRHLPRVPRDHLRTHTGVYVEDWVCIPAMQARHRDVVYIVQKRRQQL